MTDTDVILVLNDGREIAVVYPARVGREYETAWLPGHPGSREWNIDILGSKERVTYGNPRYIVGEWGTGYGVTAGVVEVVPFGLLSGVKPLPPELQEKADGVRAVERQRREEEMRDNRPILWAEFQLLVERVRTLEKMVKELI